MGNNGETDSPNYNHKGDLKMKTYYDEMKKSGTFSLHTVMTGVEVIWMGDDRPGATVSGITSVYKAETARFGNETIAAAARWCAENKIPLRPTA